MESSLIAGFLRGRRRQPPEAGSSPDGVGAQDVAADQDRATDRQEPTRQFRLLKWFAAASFVAVMMVIAAFAALWRYKVGIIPVIGASAAAALAYSLLT